MCCGCAGALGALLTDDEAGRVKLVRVAMGIGRVSGAYSLPKHCYMPGAQHHWCSLPAVSA